MKSIAKRVLSILSVAVFLGSVAGPAGNAFAADEWPVWPRQGAATPQTAGEAGEDAGDKIGSTVDYGTIAKYALIGGAGLAIIIALASGSSSSSSNH